MIPPSLVEAIARAYLEQIEHPPLDPAVRPPSVEEIAGALWWANLSIHERTRWLQAARTNSARIAWLYARSRWR